MQKHTKFPTYKLDVDKLSDKTQKSIEALKTDDMDLANKIYKNNF